MKRYRPVLDGFLAFIGDVRARASVGSITPAEIERFRDGQLGEGKGKSTADFAVKVLRAVFNAARRKGIAPVNPAEAVEHLNAEAEERHPFTEEQACDLLNAARGTDWFGAALLAWNTGARLNDVANLTWENVNLAAGTLSFREQKAAGRKRGKAKETVVCLHHDLREWLESLPAGDTPTAPLLHLVLRLARENTFRPVAAHRVPSCVQRVGKARCEGGWCRAGRRSITRRPAGSWVVCVGGPRGRGRRRVGGRVAGSSSGNARGGVRKVRGETGAWGSRPVEGDRLGVEA